ncbi:MAG TPA: hypothetical protein VJV78_03830 [Polyangiales bacterium]|nr:hypothetical protein [Polyangiales bacterium]
MVGCRVIGDLAMQRARINQQAWPQATDADSAEEMLALVAEAASALDVDRELMTAAQALLALAPPSPQPSPQQKVAAVVNVTAELAVTPQGTLDAYKRSLERLEHGMQTSLALAESASGAHPAALATDDTSTR